MTKNKNLELKKHVGTIHSSGSMSLLQRKIANGLLYNAYDELLTKNEHQIGIRDLCTLIGYTSNDQKIIKMTLVNLLSTVVEWNLVDKNSLGVEEGTWNASSIIADASISGPICTYSYSGRMKQLLYHPSIYGRLNMTVQSKFKSSYGLALYENCIRYQNLNSTPWIDFSIFRKLMGVNETKYVTFAEFKKRVLNIGIREVNLHAPIVINPELQKIQRKVISIRFLIQQKSNQKKELEVNDHSGGDGKKINSANKQVIYEKLQDKFGLSQKQILEILSTHDEQYILSKISLIEVSPSFLNGKIKNLAKYLLDALEKDYQPPKSSKEVIVKDDMVLREDKRKQEFQERLKEKYNKYVRLKIFDNFNSLEKFQQDLIVDGFLKANESDSYVIASYEKKGLLSGCVASRFVSFVMDGGFELLNGIMSFEDYCLHHQNQKRVA